MTGHACRQGEDGAEEGSGTVSIVGVLATGLVLALVLVTLSYVHEGRVRAQGAADLAALAAADLAAVGAWVDVGEAPCNRAQEVANENGARLLSCTLVGLDVRVEVLVDVGGVSGAAYARARAGPAD